MFVVASHEQLAKSFAAEFKVSTEVAQDEVRRLGVDYSLNANKRRKMMVAKSRASRHKARWTLLRSLRKVARGPLIFQAGLLPGTLYGAHCCRPEPRFLRTLQAQWADCQEARPLGVPKTMWLVAGCTSGSPLQR